MDSVKSTLPFFVGAEFLWRGLLSIGGGVYFVWRVPSSGGGGSASAGGAGMQTGVEVATFNWRGVYFIWRVPSSVGGGLFQLEGPVCKLE